MATKYYGVQKGRSTGVFLSWAECQKQVTGFPGALFKSFATWEEAIAEYMKTLVQAQDRKEYMEIFLGILHVRNT